MEKYILLFDINFFLDKKIVNLLAICVCKKAKIEKLEQLDAIQNEDKAHAQTYIQRRQMKLLLDSYYKFRVRF